MTGSPAAIVLRHVSVHRGGVPVLRDISLAVEAGEIVMLLGPNGAGKSTLLSAIARDIGPSSGSIELSGTSIESFSRRQLARNRAVYSATESPRLGYTARTIVEFGRLSVPTSRRDDDTQVVTEAMKATESVVFADRIFASLSEGERVRVGLARVFAQQSPILLLDEPTAALDIRHQHLVLQHLRKLTSDGCSVIAALHDFNLACAYADRIGFIKAGCLVAIGNPAEVVNSEMLEDVFGWPMMVLNHPTQTRPVVLPMVADELSRPEGDTG